MNTEDIIDEIEYLKKKNSIIGKNVEYSTEKPHC